MWPWTHASPGNRENSEPTAAPTDPPATTSFLCRILQNIKNRKLCPTHYKNCPHQLVFGFCENTNPKHIIGPASNYMFGVCQNWHTPNISYDAGPTLRLGCVKIKRHRQLNTRPQLNPKLMFLCHFNRGRQPKHMAPDIWMKIMALRTRTFI